MYCLIPNDTPLEAVEIESYENRSKNYDHNNPESKQSQVKRSKKSVKPSQSYGDQDPTEPAPVQKVILEILDEEQEKSYQNSIQSEKEELNVDEQLLNHLKGIKDPNYTP